MDYPDSLEQLIGFLKLLPGVGRRSAERLALALSRFTPEQQRELGGLLAALPDTLGRCPECGNLAEAGRSCHICRAGSRDRSIICVVEDFTRIGGIEKSGGYRGVYHILGGRLSPLDDEGEERLRIAELEARLDTGTVRELILALGGDVEGRATALYLAKRLAGRGIKLTQLAQGLPAGGDLAYADSATILAALNGRFSI